MDMRKFHTCQGFRKKKYVTKKLITTKYIVGLITTTLKYIAGSNTFPLPENQNAQHPILYQLLCCSYINKKN